MQKIKEKPLAVISGNMKGLINMIRTDYEFDEYQVNVLRTANRELNWNETVENCLLGLIGELGEVVEQLNGNSEVLLKFVEIAKVAEALKKQKYHGKTVELENLNGEQYNLFYYSNRIITFLPTTEHGELTKELGDTLYYLTWLIDTCGLELSEVAQLNVEKLRKRYGEGFSVEKSLNRKD